MKKSKGKKKKIVFVLVAVLLAVLVADSFFQGDGSVNKVCFEMNCFAVEVVDTPEARAQGLMFREHLPEDEGMLFVFEEELVYSFWMKNTLIPLDMIWVNSDYEVVYVHEWAMPCEEDPCPSINPGVPALYVLEVNAGISDKIGLSAGDGAELIFS